MPSKTAAPRLRSEERRKVEKRKAAGYPARTVVENVRPQIDGGRFPIKRVPGQKVRVTADVFADGHDVISARLLWRHASGEWQESAMEPLGNDAWAGEFSPGEMGRYYYTVEGWIDHFQSWRNGFLKKQEVGQDLTVELLIGADMLEAAAERARGEDRKHLLKVTETLRDESKHPAERAPYALHGQILELMLEYPDREHAGRAEREYEVEVDRPRADFSAWYEMFPRSAGGGDRHGTFADCEQRLPYVAEMGFDVLYLPPIHPIGHAFRKGKNNNPAPEGETPGSPWAIGSELGGHDAIHSELGTEKDLRRLVRKAAEFGIEVALDIAFQVSPDHPYVKAHPEWFIWRPDGTVQYAENPPKKYQDIYPLNFESSDWRALWQELKRVFDHWIEQGVKIFRVDNPHTKPFAFWEWVIAEIKKEHPDVLLLAEAFTRPKVMYRLAKVGFTQSYTYFAWRNAKWEIEQYMTELTRTEVAEFFRPNFWPNTPDILTEYLQQGGRAAFISRLVLAGTLTSNYGIYGPAFELMENRPLHPGKEEYLDSEKYEIRSWDLDDPKSLKTLIATVNRARRENPALHSNESLQFHLVNNDQLVAYSKHTPDMNNIVLAVVNVDFRWTQAGMVTLPLEQFQIAADEPYELHDLLSGQRYIWTGPTNYVELRPTDLNAHLFRVIRRHRP